MIRKWSSFLKFWAYWFGVNHQNCLHDFTYLRWRCFSIYHELELSSVGKHVVNTPFNLIFYDLLSDFFIFRTSRKVYMEELVFESWNVHFSWKFSGSLNLAPLPQRFRAPWLQWSGACRGKIRLSLSFSQLNALIWNTELEVSACGLTGRLLACACNYFEMRLPR